MKKFKLIATALMITAVSAICNAQTNCFPVNNATGMVELKGKVFMDGKSKNEIFTKLFTWGTNKAVLGSEGKGGGQALSDRESGIFKFSTQIMYDYKGGFRTMYFDVMLQVSDGYYNYTVNDFSMNKKPMETYLSAKEGDEFYKQSFENICKKMNALLDEMKSIN